jgi:hypothetical protein
MAATITTQADLKAAELILPSEIERLTTAEREADNWVSIHTAAWSAVLKELYKRRDKLEESDLDTPAELEDATLFYVLHIAYRQSEIETDQVESKKWFRRYQKEISELEISSSGATLQRTGERKQSRLARG